MGKGYTIRTQQGYDFFECSGAIQKGIRRGDEKVALYFMVEMFNSGYDEYVWKRLKVVVSEDVGTAEPRMASHINALYQFYIEQKKKKSKNREEKLFLVHAVVSLCRCKKSRDVCWLGVSLWRSHYDEKMAIPDYAFDMHNRKGLSMGRGMEHFWKEGSKLENYMPAPNEELHKEEAYKWHKKHKKGMFINEANMLLPGMGDVDNGEPELEDEEKPE